MPQRTAHHILCPMSSWSVTCSYCEVTSSNKATINCIIVSRPLPTCFSNYCQLCALSITCAASGSLISSVCFDLVQLLMHLLKFLLWPLLHLWAAYSFCLLLCLPAEHHRLYAVSCWHYFAFFLPHTHAIKFSKNGFNVHRNPVVWPVSFTYNTAVLLQYVRGN